MYLLHHQVYNPADVIWDAEDWLSMNETEGDPNICSYCHKFAHNGECDINTNDGD